jgi:hypothetical protein
MQKKFGTILNGRLLEEAKEFCHKEHSTLNHFLEKAISEYLRKKKEKSLAFSNVEASFGVLKIRRKALKNVLEEDIYEA